MIPVTSSRVNLALLDPILAHRVERMLSDPRMAGYRVVSAVRTYEQQKSLYDGWRKRLASVPGFGHYNLAANPDRIIFTGADGSVWRGSYHMVQSDGRGHAVDLRKPITHSVDRANALVRTVGREYGLHQTVRSEWWHLQARGHQYFDGPLPLNGDGMYVLKRDVNDTDGIVVAGAGEFHSTSIGHWEGVVGDDRVFVSPHMDTMLTGRRFPGAANASPAPSAETVAQAVLSKIKQLRLA